MKKLHSLLIGSMCSILVLSACVAQKTPQQVAQAFWESVISTDSEGVVEYSTLTDAREYDGFSLDWSGFQPSLGRVVIEGDEARIVYEFSRPDNAGAKRRKFTTYLVRHNEEWKVDYTRTNEALSGGSLANLLGQFDRLGKEISDQFRTSSKDFREEMERVSEQFAELSDAIGHQASERIKKYGEQLRRSIQELADSVQRALKEQERRLSDRDRRVLTEVAGDLNEGSEHLSRPSLHSIADSSTSVGIAQQRLESTDEEVVGKYKEEWREWGKRFEADMKKILDELSMSAEGQG